MYSFVCSTVFFYSTRVNRYTTARRWPRAAAAAVVCLKSRRARFYHHFVCVCVFTCGGGDDGERIRKPFCKFSVTVCYGVLRDVGGNNVIMLINRTGRVRLRHRVALAHTCAPHSRDKVLSHVETPARSFFVFTLFSIPIRAGARSTFCVRCARGSLERARPFYY